MKPIDFRLATFADVQVRLRGAREAVFFAWQRLGPGTTAEVCARAELSILSFRPRSTELYQLGYIRLAEEQPAKDEGTYRAREYPELVAWFEERHESAREQQAQLALK